MSVVGAGKATDALWRESQVYAAAALHGGGMSIGPMRQGRDAGYVLMWRRTAPQYLRERPPIDDQNAIVAMPLSSTKRTMSVQGDPGRQHRLVELRPRPKRVTATICSAPSPQCPPFRRSGSRLVSKARPRGVSRDARGCSTSQASGAQIVLHSMISGLARSK